MSNRKKSWKSRACGTRANDGEAKLAFEQALWGDDLSERKPFDPAPDRKTLQLCRQVQRALMLALMGECGDDLLRDVLIDSVEPMGGAGQLLVRVCVPGNVPAMDVLIRLNERTAKLRSIVAASICRKRVPMLSFVIVPLSQGGIT